jgi:hypothetical protein
MNDLSLSFWISYILPLVIINALVFVLIYFFKREYCIHFFIFIFVLVMYIISNWPNVESPSVFNHYVLLSDAFLHGRFHLAMDPGFHDVTFYNNNYFISQPPLPALLMLPFVLIYGVQFNDILFTILIAAINCAIMYDILLNLNKTSEGGLIPKSNAKFLSAFFAFGTVAWSIAVQGQVWHTAHIVTLFFLLLAINEALGKKRYLLVGLFAASAIAGRPSVFWAFPFFVIVAAGEFLFNKETKTFFVRMVLFLIPYFAWAALLGLFNYARFGNPFEFGFAYMNHAEYLQARLDNFGTLNIHYLKENLSVAFANFFTIKSTPPYLIPPQEGMSMFVTSPLLIYAFRSFSKGSCVSLFKKGAGVFFKTNYIAIAAIAASICTAIPLLLYFNTGWIQFGYRYILDYLPFLVILMAYGMRRRITVISVILLIVSCAMILYGILVYLHYPEVI